MCLLRITTVSLESSDLSGRGLRCWFDEMEMKNLIVDQMCEGIDESAVVVVFLTDRYVEKVRSKDEKDNCKKEFNYAETRKGGQCMIPVVMDPDAGSSWAGPVGMVLGSKLYIDFSDDTLWQRGQEARFEAKLLELQKRIETIISTSVSGSVATHVVSGVKADSGSSSSSSSERQLSKELEHLLAIHDLDEFSDQFLTNRITTARQVAALSVAELKEDLKVPPIPARKLFAAATALVDTATYSAASTSTTSATSSAASTSTTAPTSSAAPQTLKLTSVKGNAITYTGPVVKGKACGKGRMVSDNGDVYEGEVRENLQHGRGVWTLADGSRYDGEFQEGKQHGRGVFTWPGGTR